MMLPCKCQHTTHLYHFLITSQERTDPVYANTWFVEIESDMSYHGVYSFSLFSAPVSHQRSIVSHTPKSLKHTEGAIFTVSVYTPPPPPPPSCTDLYTYAALYKYVMQYEPLHCSGLPYYNGAVAGYQPHR